MGIYLDDNEDNISAIIANYEKNLKENTIQYFDVDDYIALIDYYILSSKINKANIALSIGLSQHPNALDLIQKKAEILTLDNEYNDALEIVEQLEPLKNDTDLFLLKGNILNNLNKLNDAKNAFEQAIRIEDNQEDLLDIYFKIGLSFQQVNKYKEAVKYHKSLFDLSPTHEENLFELAYCYEQMNIPDLCIKYYNIYLDENPYSEKIWYNLGIIYNKKKDYKKAIESYDFSLAIRPENKDAIFNKGNALFYQRNYNESLSCYLNCLNFPDNHSLTHTYIGECYEKKGEFDYAKMHYRKALEIDEDLAEAWFGLGMVAKLQLKFGEAIHYMEESIKKDSSYGESYLELAKIYEIIGEKTLALNAYKYPTLTIPHEWYYLLELVKFYHREQKTEIGLKLLEENREKFYDEVEYYYYISLFSFLTNKKEQAKHYLKEGLFLDKEQIDTILYYCQENMTLIGTDRFNEFKNLL